MAIYFKTRDGNNAAALKRADAWQVFEFQPFNWLTRALEHLEGSYVRIV